LWLRAPEDEKGNIVLNMNATWRSRDLYKAWPDNMIGLTFLQGYLARQLQEKMDKPVKTGRYAEINASLHIYGQDFSAVKGDAENGIRSFFDKFKTVDEYINHPGAMTSETARDCLVVPQLKQLLTPGKIEEWKFGEPQIKLIKGLIDDLESGKYLP